jgi:type I restriction enzyme S subunit
VPSYRFVLPAEKIAKSFASIADPIFKRIDDNDREARTLAVLRDALLPKFITGQLRVNDVERLLRRHT